MREAFQRHIKELSQQINQTRVLLTALETQRTMLYGIEHGLQPPLDYSDNWSHKTPQWFKDMVAQSYQPRLPHL